MGWFSRTSDKVDHYAKISEEQALKIIEQENQITNLSNEFAKVKQANLLLNSPGSGQMFVTTLRFDGEKTPGGIGPLQNRIPDYYRLSIRSWDAYKTDKMAQTVINRYIDWIIGAGLRLKSNPNRIVLESEGIFMDKTAREKFNDFTESRWNVWSATKDSSHSGNMTFIELQRQILKHGAIGGDCLVVLRYERNIPTVQMIDGSRVITPVDKFDREEDGSIVICGIHMDKSGKHLGYYVAREYSFQLNASDFDYIPAFNEYGIRTAFQYCGTTWRCDANRGIPLLAAVLETLSKLDRYSEATVANAEEIAKIAFQIVHGRVSDGSNPMFKQFAAAFNTDSGGAASTPVNPVDSVGNQLAKDIGVSMEKTVVNMPVDSEMKPLNHSNNIEGFKEFYETHCNLICACIGIPPNVAYQLYLNSYSSSRAATKDWDHTMTVRRRFFSSDCMEYVYSFWLWIQVLQDKIPAPGYLQAINTENTMVRKSYEMADFVGAHFPHIDPMKEVQAERAKLGPLYANVPLTDAETASEVLASGDHDSIMEQAAEELATAGSFGLLNKPTPPTEKNE